MPDIYVPAKQSAGPPNNGSAVTFLQKIGIYQKVDPKINTYSIPVDSGILDNRFDDKTYYSS